jgi:hypothetical protein
VKLGIWKPPEPEPVAVKTDTDPSFHEFASGVRVCEDLVDRAFLATGPDRQAVSRVECELRARSGRCRASWATRRWLPLRVGEARA